MVSTFPYTNIILLVVFSNKRYIFLNRLKSCISDLFSVICLYMNKTIPLTIFVLIALA